MSFVIFFESDILRRTSLMFLIYYSDEEGIRRARVALGCSENSQRSIHDQSHILLLYFRSTKVEYENEINSFDSERER